MTIAERSPAASLENVSKRYGKRLALDQLTLQCEPGQLLALLGPNGAGKSTAIALWLGLLQPDQGEVRVFDAAATALSSRRAVGVMLQDVNLPPELHPREILTLTSSYYPAPLSVAQILRLTHTEGLADRRYGTLSTGQKRQIQFAAAVCGQPRLLFLDEPTVGLDVDARHAMWSTIRQLLEGGCAIVLTTHYLEEAEALADRVAVLVRGRLVALGTPEELRSSVAQTRISCESTLDLTDVRLWPGVKSAVRKGREIEICTANSEELLPRLLAADPSLRGLQIARPNLAEAFTELTKEAA